MKIKPGATTGIIYVITCKKCDKIYVGQTGDSMAIRWSKHKYDIVNCPDQNELATHCHHNHDLEKGYRNYHSRSRVPTCWRKGENGGSLHL